MFENVLVGVVVALWQTLIKQEFQRPQSPMLYQDITTTLLQRHFNSIFPEDF